MHISAIRGIVAAACNIQANDSPDGITGPDSAYRQKGARIAPILDTETLRVTIEARSESMVDTDRLRLAIAGGGTGGHVLPALAVINVLRQDDRLDNVVWIGSHDGVEREAAAGADIPFTAIPTGKLRRYFSVRNVADAMRIPLGVIAARRALRRASPHVVLSTGGFVSVPTVIAARGIAPVVTHEQTATIGLATRIDARFSTVLAISHKQAEAIARSIHPRVALTGNPVRAELADGDRSRGRTRFRFFADLPVLLVMGGARGASPINQRVAALLPDLLERAQVIHQTGPASANTDAEQLRALRERLPVRLRQRYVVLEFIGDELPDAYALADLVIARAGAGTIAELAFVGKPAILIPLPGTSSDEQTVNARVLSDVGAAVLLPQQDASADRLQTAIHALLGDAPRRERMATAARSVAQPDAAMHLAEIVYSLANPR